LRWCVNVSDATGKITRKAKFKLLGPVLPEHKRNTKRIPPEIQAAAERILGPVNSGKVQNVLLTVGELVENEYFPHAALRLKASSLQVCKDRWNRYLKNRVSKFIVRDFQRVDAFLLWSDIHNENPHLSRQSMAHIRFQMSGVFEFALNRGLYEGQNPCKADLPAGLTPRKKGEAYTVNEVRRLLSLLTSPLAQGIVALFFGSGLRKGEIAGLDWRDYERTETGATIHICRSVWQGQVTTPKTEASGDVVCIGSEIVEYVEAYRQFVGGVKEGFMFGYSHDEPINLDSFARWQLKPLMNRCATCKEQKSKHNEKTGHAYERDESIPAWKGFHAFRRGNATFLAKQFNGDGLAAASLMLRHTDESVTQEHYVINTQQERRAMKAAKALQIGETRIKAAAAVGAGLKQDTVN